MSDMDQFLDELVCRVDEIEGSCLNLGPGLREVWVHTPAQIAAWIKDAREVWALPDES